MKHTTKHTTVATLIRDINSHLDQLQKFEGKGKNPKSFVRGHASFSLSALVRLAELLGIISPNRSKSITRAAQLRVALKKLHV